MKSFRVIQLIFEKSDEYLFLFLAFVPVPEVLRDDEYFSKKLFLAFKQRKKDTRTQAHRFLRKPMKGRKEKLSNQKCGSLYFQRLFSSFEAWASLIFPVSLNHFFPVKPFWTNNHYYFWWNLWEADVARAMQRSWNFAPALAIPLFIGCRAQNET